MGKLTLEEAQRIVKEADVGIEQALEWMADNLPKIPEWARSNFVPSVLKQARKKGAHNLSLSQQAWMFKLRAEAISPEAKPRLPVMKCQNLTDIFTAASKNLKYPKVTFKFTLTPEARDRNVKKYGTDFRDLDLLNKKTAALLVRLFDQDFSIRFQRAGQRSHYPGCLQVTNAGKSYERIWYGRILQTGEFEMSPACTDDVREFVKAFNQYTTAIATFFGRNSGNCCYCDRWLTDERSLDVGYGQTCAGHYNQPWGKAA